MTKFFMPVQRGAPKGFAHPPKVKKSSISCSQTLQRKVMELLKRTLTRQIQKTIRKLKEEGQGEGKAGLLQRLEQLKGITKHHLKQLSYFVLLNELNVEPASLKKLFSIPAEQQQQPLPDHLQSFYDAIREKSSFSEEMEDAQRIKNTVSEKKKIKKEKAKIKKKTKITIKRQNQHQDMKDESGEGMAVEAEEDDRSEGIVQQKAEKIKKDKPKKVPAVKPQKTEFKKTGRNKFLQQKKNKKHGRRQPQPQPQIPNPKIPTPNRDETPHPSWQAKREIKNQMFIQPFQGKKILL